MHPRSTFKPKPEEKGDDQKKDEKKDDAKENPEKQNGSDAASAGASKEQLYLIISY